MATKKNSGRGKHVIHPAEFKLQAVQRMRWRMRIGGQSRAAQESRKNRVSLN